MTTRRGFLIVAAGATALLALRVALSSDEQAIAAVIRNCLSYLKLDEAGVTAFARDLAASRKIDATKLRLASAVGLLRLDSGADHRLARMLRHGEERVVNYYLLSTDFFASGADETRPVRYLGFYDPQNGACRNPFPNFARSKENG